MTVNSPLFGHAVLRYCGRESPDTEIKSSINNHTTYYLSQTIACDIWGELNFGLKHVRINRWKKYPWQTPVVSPFCPPHYEDQLMAADEPDTLISPRFRQGEPKATPVAAELPHDRLKIAQLVASLMANKWMRDRAAKAGSRRGESDDENDRRD